MKVVWSLSPKPAILAGNSAFSQEETLSGTRVKRGNPLLVSRGGGGQKEESNRHLEQTKLSSLGCSGVTLAFRTVQWSELVPLSYKRLNSNVPKEAVITIRATLLLSITCTYKLVNSHPPHTPNCPLSCMHFIVWILKRQALKRQKISLPTLNRV